MAFGNLLDFSGPHFILRNEVLDLLIFTFVLPLISHECLPVLGPATCDAQVYYREANIDPLGKRKTKTNAISCLSPPQLTARNQRLGQEQRRDYRSRTGTWLGPLFSILTHCLCSCKWGTCNGERDTVSGATLHEGREETLVKSKERKCALPFICSSTYFLLTHSF